MRKLVFVRLPNAEHSMPLALNGDETYAQLCETLHNLTKFSGKAANPLKLSCNGHPLTNVRDLRANATITVAAASLLGGMEGKLSALAGALSEDAIYAKFECVTTFK